MRILPSALASVFSGGHGDGGAERRKVDRYDRGARPVELNPPTGVDPWFFRSDPFTRLPQKTQQVLSTILALDPGAKPQIEKLIGLPQFVELSDAEQRAVLSPARPERVPHALAILDNHLVSALPGDKCAFFGLDPRVQRSILTQLDHFAGKKTAGYLARLANVAWFATLGTDDQIRAAKVVAFGASRAIRARFEADGVSQKRIIENTLESILRPDGFGLEFQDLAFDPSFTIAGHRTEKSVVLNRAAIPADDRRIGAGDHPGVESRIALATLVHEVNHLHNTTPIGPTYAAFTDEYRAWFVDFVADVGRLPTKAEALRRCRDLFTADVYDDIRSALFAGSDESKKILAFMQRFGDAPTPEAALSLTPADPTAPAPEPDPRLNLENAC